MFETTRKQPRDGLSDYFYIFRLPQRNICARPRRFPFNLVGREDNDWCPLAVYEPARLPYKIKPTHSWQLVVSDNEIIVLSGFNLCQSRPAIFADLDAPSFKFEHFFDGTQDELVVFDAQNRDGPHSMSHPLTRIDEQDNAPG